MTLVLFLFATTLLISGFFEIFFSGTMSTAFEDLSLMKLPYLLKFVILFMLLTTLEFSLFYTNLSSNRLYFIEKYLPIVPAIFIGGVSASLIVENDLLDVILFFGLYVMTFLVDIMVIVLLIRLRKVRDKFSERKPEQALLTHLIIMLFAFLVYQSGDLIGLIGILISLDLYTITIFAQLAFLPIFGFALLFQSRSIWNILDRIDFSLLLNELT